MNQNNYYRHPLYSTWRAMLNRCYYKTHISYKNYGAKGVTVCDRWRHSYHTFFSDMGMKPSKRHTLDRKDVTKGYEPSNCRWATWEEQAANRRKRTKKSAITTEKKRSKPKIIHQYNDEMRKLLQIRVEFDKARFHVGNECVCPICFSIFLKKRQEHYFCTKKHAIQYHNIVNRKTNNTKTVLMNI